jgi:hypothetical protein
MRASWVVWSALLLTLVVPAAIAQTPVGTAFTYQGRLIEAGAPATGSYDLEFRVYDASAAGMQTGPTVVKEDVNVTNGLFTVTLEFGGGVFTGSARWLAIGVRPGATTDPFTLVGPRQELTPTPNAIFSSMAPWLGVSGKPSGFLDDADNDVLGGLSCASGQLAKWGGASWACAADGDGGTDWSLTGNSGTGPTNFLGTSNNVALELRVNGRRALRLEPHPQGPNLVGGLELNAVTAGAFASVIGGGGDSMGTNRVTDSYGVVGGGRNNQAGDGAGTIGDRIYATVAGGNFNTASGNSSAIGGGTANVTSGAYAMIPGGLNNTAAGFYSFAAGRLASANHDGSFVWGDSTAVGTASTGNDQFLVRASGGVTIFTPLASWRLEANASSPRLIGGFNGNNVSPGVAGAVVGGGGHIGQVNRITDDFGSVGGGAGNQAGDGLGTTQDRPHSTVSGGVGNVASGAIATVGGGAGNVASGGGATVGGGGFNGGSTASGGNATVGGGGSNEASGLSSVIAGGFDNIASGTDASVGGGYLNVAGAYRATVAGGTQNVVTDDYGSIGGGASNQVGDNAGISADRPYATVAGGASNFARSGFATIGGGSSNQAGTVAPGNDYATVAGGSANQALGLAATVGGGGSNAAIGNYATAGGGNGNFVNAVVGTVSGGLNNAAGGYAGAVPGGELNAAAGPWSFAAGRQAKANHAGAFVWGDSTAADLASTGANQLVARASGGFWFGSTSAPSFVAARLINTSTGAYLTTTGVWTNASDRDLKEGFAALDGRALLDTLARLPISSWSYKADPGVRHIGPIAQDFHALFGLGPDDRTITTVDPAGVALAAIQELYRTTRALEEKTAELEVLKAALAGLAARVESLQARIQAEP